LDVDRVRLSAEVMTNWLPYVQGAMGIRPGLEHIGSVRNDTGACRTLPFVASTTDTALFEFSDKKMRVWTDDALVTRETRTTGMTDIAADTGLWTGVYCSGGGTMTYADPPGDILKPTDTGTVWTLANVSGLVLDGRYRGGVARATRKVALGDTGDEDAVLALKIVVGRGEVALRIGTDTGFDDVFGETTLRTGYHNLAFTVNDTGGFHISLLNDKDRDAVVSSVTMADTGTLMLPTPWTADDVGLIRTAQSADVVFCACSGIKQKRIERRQLGSWSVVDYETNDGPFFGRSAQGVKLKILAHSGNTTLVSNQQIFSADHVGALYRLYHNGYAWQFSIADEDVYTPPHTITGITSTGDNEVNERAWEYTVSGTWSGKLRVLSSTDDKEIGPYAYTRISDTGINGNYFNNYVDSNGTRTLRDRSENSVNNNVTEFIKIGFGPGDHQSGTATVLVNNNTGGDFGIVRCTGYDSPTQMQVEVLRPVTRIGDTGYTNDWQEGWWHGARTFPSAVEMYEGRLWWFSGTYAYGSIPDGFNSYDAEEEGDSAPIVRSLGEGAVDSIVFATGLARLLLGTAGGVIALRSSSLDEVLTNENMSAKTVTTQGSKSIPAVKIDTRAVYVHRSGVRAFELAYDVDAQNYVAKDLTKLNPDILMPGVVDIGVQRQPETRIHFALADGTVAVLTYEPQEELMCWSLIRTDGNVEQVSVLPGEVEDKVYYVVARTIGGVTKRYLEKLARLDETAGTTITKLADSFRLINDTGGTLDGLTHLAGETVCVWRSGRDQGTYVVDVGGSITGVGGTDTGVVGLVYTADYKSAKLAYAAEGGTALIQPKRVERCGFILYKTHVKGLRFGSDTGHLDLLPDIIERGGTADTGTIMQVFDEHSFVFPGRWSTDERLVLRAQSPRPATVLAAIVSLQTSDNIG
jgi:hypothetical protein